MLIVGNAIHRPPLPTNGRALKPLTIYSSSSMVKQNLGTFPQTLFQNHPINLLNDFQVFLSLKYS